MTGCCRGRDETPVYAVRWPAVMIGAAVVLALPACQSGIGSDANRAVATSRAYETRVAELERRVAEQDAALAASTPRARAATPVPFAERWRVEVGGGLRRVAEVGGAEGVTPIAARGSFVVVPVTVTNMGARPAAFQVLEEMRLLAADGTEYAPDATATGAAYLLDLGLTPAFGARQPGIAYDDVVVFDVPPDASDVVLVARDGSFAERLDLGQESASTPSG